MPHASYLDYSGWQSWSCFLSFCQRRCPLSKRWKSLHKSYAKLPVKVCKGLYANDAESLLFSGAWQLIGHPTQFGTRIWESSSGRTDDHRSASDRPSTPTCSPERDHSSVTPQSRRDRNCDDGADCTRDEITEPERTGVGVDGWNYSCTRRPDKSRPHPAGSAVARQIVFAQGLRTPLVIYG